MTDDATPNPQSPPTTQIATRPSWTVLPPVDERDTTAPSTVLGYLCRKFPRIPAATWRARMAQGKVIDEHGRVLGLEAPYRAYLKVGYFREIDTERPIPFEAQVLFRSPHLLVVDKPPFLPVAPVGRFVNQCLIYRLEQELGLKGLAPVHRLDRLTSGLVLLSADPEARTAYAGLFARREIDKEYVALGHAPEKPQGDRWTIESVISEGEPWFRRISRPGPEPNSRTEIELIGWRDGRARFRLKPITGKTHQLRVHLAGLGYPIVGDPFYPELQPEQPDDFTSPMALIARQLRFRDPFSKESVRFSSAWTLDRLGFDEASDR